MSKNDLPPMPASHRLTPRPLLATAALWLVCATASATALAPEYTGQFGVGGGATVTFAQIDSNWHGSTVLWNDATLSYGTGSPIGSYAWGTGLWGLADWQATQDALQGLGGAGAPPIINSWTGVQPTINFSNAIYNQDYAATWGQATLVPFFDAAGAVAAQENWTVHASGYIRITDAGSYDFSVLNDDGFFLRLIGAAGTSLEIGRDYLNPRDRDGFDQTLQLTAGLYGLDLGMWNRLEAGVVDLRWQQPGDTSWTLVPTTSLLPLSAVPEAGTAAMLAAGLGMGLLVALRRRSSRAAGRSV